MRSATGQVVAMQVQNIAQRSVVAAPSVLRLACCLGVLLFGATWAQAQQRLIVNGHEIAGINSSLVPGTALAPAAAYAAALGARYVYNSSAQVASFQLAGRFASVQIHSDASSAASVNQALRVDGQLRDSRGGVLHNQTVYVPVKALATAFGGQTEYLERDNIVLVVFPRARLTRLRRPEFTLGSYDRIILEFSAPVSIDTLRDELENRVTFRFERSDIDTPQTLRGFYFIDASLERRAGNTELSLRLRPDSHYDIYSSSEDGHSVIIDVFPRGMYNQERQDEVPASFHIVLDPASRSYDPVAASLANTSMNGQARLEPASRADVAEPEVPAAEPAAEVASEVESEVAEASPQQLATLSLDFAQQLGQTLSDQGHTVRLTRESSITLSPENRSNAGIGADFFLSLQPSDLPAGQLNIYYLGDADSVDSLHMAVRHNAESLISSFSTDSVRRQVLLNFVPDLSLGERWAQALSAELAQRSSYRARDVRAAPLYVLGGAAGRGLLLEVSLVDLQRADFADTLAAAIHQVLGNGGSP